MRRRAPRPYANPYLAGVALGCVLLAAFLIMGRGLGASGAFATAAAGAVTVVAPEHSAASPFFSRYLDDDGPWVDWLLVELIGVVIGGFLSAWMAGRWRRGMEGGQGLSVQARAAWAAGGGALMGIGAVLARGCTSGQALTGGALLSVGSWAFMLTAFAGGYLAAPFFRRLWQ
jgi:uncharacterized membrane protein YedE/YeeE